MKSALCGLLLLSVVTAVFKGVTTFNYLVLIPTTHTPSACRSPRSSPPRYLFSACVLRWSCPQGQVVARPMMYLALTYDHRLIDGREAVTFLKSVALKVQDPTRLLLDL